MKTFGKLLKTATISLALVSFAGAAQAELNTQVFTAGGPGFQVTSTLVTGETDAVLIDAQFTLSEAHRLTAQILESGKDLKTIFITHGHPDHYFGLEVLKAAFPGAQILAQPSVVAEIKATAANYVKNWGPLYGNNLTKDPIIPTAFEGNELTLEEETLELIQMAPGEIENTTIVHIPALKTVIAGDVVNNGVHVWMAETDAERRVNWLANLNRIAGLNPEIVIAGHKVAGLADTPATLEFTAQYISDFEQALAASATPEQLVEKMLAKYDGLALPVILDIAAKAMFEGGHEH